MNKLQACILEIFKEVSSICEAHDIPYYAIGGTCIGAIRHNGFIPWDDDLDIAVPIEQYRKLRKLLELELPDYYSIHDCDNKIQYHYVFMKVEDDRTAYIQKSMKQFKNGYMGVYIDIMPLAGVPSNKNERIRFIGRLKIYQVLNIVRRFPIGSQFSVKGKLASILLKPVTLLFRYNYFSNKYLRYLENLPTNMAEYVGYVWSPPDINRWTFPMRWFESTTMLPFEDTIISCPCNYHDYLKQQFGDYMTPPPENEQNSPHEGILDLIHSYKEYQNGTKKL